MGQRKSEGGVSDVTRRILRRTRDALFIGADTLRVNCGRCWKELVVRLEDIRAERIIDCEECARGLPRANRHGSADVRTERRFSSRWSNPLRPGTAQS